MVPTPPRETVRRSWNCTLGVTGTSKSMIIDDARVDLEVAVGSHAKRLVELDPIRDLVGGKSIHPVVRPGRLIRRVIRHLVLEHNRFTLVAVPEDLEILVMF